MACQVSPPSEVRSTFEPSLDQPTLGLANDRACRRRCATSVQVAPPSIVRYTTRFSDSRGNSATIQPWFASMNVGAVRPPAIERGSANVSTWAPPPWMRKMRSCPAASPATTHAVPPAIAEHSKLSLLLPGSLVARQVCPPSAVYSIGLRHFHASSVVGRRDEAAARCRRADGSGARRCGAAASSSCHRARVPRRRRRPRRHRGDANDRDPPLTRTAATPLDKRGRVGACGGPTSDAIASSARSTSSRRIELDLRDLVVIIELDVHPRVRGMQCRLHRADGATHRGAMSSSGRSA